MSVTVFMEVGTPTENRNVMVIDTKKLHHSTLILEGVAQRCAHCGLQLTDSISIQSGLGPLCRKKAGYFKEPEVDGDLMQAMIYLSPYPEVVDFLLRHHKPDGNRGLMNGLVKLCALNRKTDLHRACTNAIQALGYTNIASVLRKSMEDISILPSKTKEGFLQMRIARRLYSGVFQSKLRQLVPNLRFDYAARSWIVPESCRQGLWKLLQEHYNGCVLTTASGTRFVGANPLPKVSSTPV